MIFLHFTNSASFLAYGAYQKTFYIRYRKYWLLVQGKMAKKLVFGSDFMIYGAPFYKWYRFTYGAVTHVAAPNWHNRYPDICAWDCFEIGSTPCNHIVFSDPLAADVADLNHRRRKWGRRGRACGPNILASCRFGAAVFKYSSCLFYYPDTENRISRRSRVIKISIVW